MNTMMTFSSADGVERSGKRDWRLVPLNLSLEAEKGLRKFRYMMSTRFYWGDEGKLGNGKYEEGFGFEVLYRDEGVGELEGGRGNVTVGKGPEILGLDMGWWGSGGMGPDKNFETGVDQELTSNLREWRATSRNWVLYTVSWDGSKVWGPLEHREWWWEKYGRHYKAKKGW